MVKLQLSFKYSELHVNYFATFNLVWRNDGHEDAHVWNFSQQAKASWFKMIFYQEDLSNLSNPLNFFPSFFSLFWHEKQNVVRLIPTLMSTFIFLVITDKDLSARNLNDNLSRTNNCGFQWKFNPDLSKEIHGIIFSSQNSKISEPSINNIATQSSIQ